MKEKLISLLCVKCIVTILLAAVFCILALRGRINTQEYLTVFAVVISFYFGSQSEISRKN